jgi:hypothetical protein
VKAISRGAQLGMIGLGYAAVSAYAAIEVYGRHLQYVNHPQDVYASSGMYAFGDEVLTVYLAFLFLIPTVFLLRFMSHYESAYTVYSQVLLGLSLTAPVSLFGLSLINPQHSNLLRDLCLIRAFRSPFVLVGMGVSRWMACFDRAKRLTNYALLIEGTTFAMLVGLFVYSVVHRG